MKNRRLKMGSYSFALVVAALAAVILLNLLIGALPSSLTQWDLTQNGLYTVDEWTKAVLASLKEEVKVHLIAQSGQEDPTIVELLRRYEEMSPYLTVSTVDPVIHPEFVSQFIDFKLNENSLIVESGKRSKAVDYTEIYTITSEEYLEYYYTYGQYLPDTFSGKNALTGAINYVTTDVLPVVGVLSGHGEKEVSSSLLQRMKNDNLAVEQTVLLRTGIPEDCKLIIICSPSSDLSAAELEMLREFLRQGNRIFLLTDAATGVLSNLSALCEDFGLQTVEGVLTEEDPSNYYLSPYYIFPSMEEHEITSPLLQGGYTPYLTVAHGMVFTEKPDVVQQVLLESSDRSYSESTPSSGQEPQRNEGEVKGPLAVGVLAHRADGAALLHVGSSSLADESVDSFSNGANLSLFLNACGWLTEKTDTISIRGDSLVSEYLTISQGEAAFWTSLFCAVIPLGILTVGTVAWWKRRSR